MAILTAVGEIDERLSQREPEPDDPEVECPNCPSYDTECAMLPSSWRCRACGHTFIREVTE